MFIYVSSSATLLQHDKFTLNFRPLPEKFQKELFSKIKRCTSVSTDMRGSTVSKKINKNLFKLINKVTPQIKL